jgi:hypothetical protein
MKFTAQLDYQNKISPLYNSDYDVMKRLKKNIPLNFDVTQPRNYEFHKKAMALFNLGFENQEDINSFDNYRKIMVMKAGFYTTEITDKGVAYFADSLSYSSMDNNKFAEVYSKVLDVIAKQLGLGNSELDKEIISFM